MAANPTYLFLCFRHIRLNFFWVHVALISATFGREEDAGRICRMPLGIRHCKHSESQNISRCIFYYRTEFVNHPIIFLSALHNQLSVDVFLHCDEAETQLYWYMIAVPFPIMACATVMTTCFAVFRRPWRRNCSNSISCLDWIYDICLLDVFLLTFF